jgi:hypothetical protein
MAKGSAKDGGLCCGTIFRTENFITTTNRSGSRTLGQNVHIEHTVPISALFKAYEEANITNKDMCISWFLKHSVTTAFSWGEQRSVKEYQSHTFAFDSEHK